MDLGLAGRTALVAGGSAGLGLACAEEFVREGASVSICSRDADRVRRAVESIGLERVSGRAADVRDHDAVRRWVDDASEEFGTVDVIVANAGGPPVGDATAFSVSDYQAAIELNLVSAINMVEAALPHMVQQQWGRILFITSISAKEPIPHLALSNTARAGVLGYAKSLSYAVARDGITVNVLCPGFTRTNRLLTNQGEDGMRRLAQDKVPVGRIGDPEDFAAAAVFLASARASFITGAVLTVDGGTVASLY